MTPGAAAPASYGTIEGSHVASMFPVGESQATKIAVASEAGGSPTHSAPHQEQATHAAKPARDAGHLGRFEERREQRQIRDSQGELAAEVSHEGEVEEFADQIEAIRNRPYDEPDEQKQEVKRPPPVNLPDPPKTGPTEVETGEGDEEQQ